MNYYSYWNYNYSICSIYFTISSDWIALIAYSSDYLNIADSAAKCHYQQYFVAFDSRCLAIAVSAYNSSVFVLVILGRSFATTMDIGQHSYYCGFHHFFVDFIRQLHLHLLCSMILTNFVSSIDFDYCYQQIYF